ncbi:SRPBCC family protein [Sphingobium nicotianae]|uniref:SRPBCC family protein n=1 Tax=Sphingobium nicotianae TaxID=2782607 RepID=A0A9X1DCE6_9SPHN|nr:SRPBCC family protein [Sphingobium nicotianae]MBT2187540.1 SRPBCC family protein [Sphingobium nicotianae]
MIANAIGAEIRRFEEREHEGQPSRAVIAERVYETDAADLWDALTNKERIPRWFLPVSGDLKLGGKYQLQGNAGGTITRCDPEKALDLTWEFGGGMSWVTVRLEPVGEGGATRLILEHIAPVGVTEEHWASFGPAAVGTGWDLSFMGLAIHIGSGAAVDPQAFAAWSASDDGKGFMRASAAAWAEAHIAGGEDPDTARAMAARTARFYTGEGAPDGGSAA